MTTTIVHNLTIKTGSFSRCMIVRPCTAAIQSLSFALYILKPFFPE